VFSSKVVKTTGIARIKDGRAHPAGVRIAWDPLFHRDNTGLNLAGAPGNLTIPRKAAVSRFPFVKPGSYL